MNQQEQPALPDTSFTQSVSRGVQLRCPICGKSPLFRTFISMHKQCAECGFKFERAPGYFLGSTYINYGVTALTTTFSYVILRFGAGYRKETILPWMLTFCLIFPLVFFRYARSLWLSLDCYFDRDGANEILSSSHVVPKKKNTD